MHAIIGIIFAAIIGLFKGNLPGNIKLKKSLNDLAVNPARTALVLFALVIGMWGVGTIIVSFTIMKNDLNENFTRTIPAHVIITADNFKKLDLEKFRSRPEIEVAEFRDLSIQRIEAYPDKWLPLWVFGVEDFNDFRLAKIYRQEGSKIPAPGTILIERDARNINVSNLTVGSNPRIRINTNTTNVLITGISFDPAQAPATQDAFIYAYTDKKTYEKLTGETTNSRLIFRLKNMKSKQEIQSMTKPILSDLEQLGVVIKTVDIPKFNEHPHQFQLNTLLLTNGVIGFLAFLMGAVLVSQLMDAILAGQIRQIGILKAIGASRYQVFGIYLTMVLLLGIVSSAIAIPLAVATGYGYAGFVAKIINFEILTTTLPGNIYLAMIMTGLFLPVILSLPALLKGTRVTVHEALADYGIGQNGTTSQTRFFSDFALPYRKLLALRNTLRRKKRLMVTIATMTLGVAIFSTGFNVRQALVSFLAKSRNAMKHDVQVVLKTQMPREKAIAPFKSIANLDRVETWNGGKGRLQTGRISTTNGIGIVALPFDSDLVKWDIIEGRWLKKSGTTEIVMNQQATEQFDDPLAGGSARAHVGKIYPIEIKGKKINAKLVGIVKEFDLAKIYIDKNQYDSFVNPEHEVNSLMFVAKNNSYQNIIALKKEIENALALSDLNVLYVMSQAERAQIIYDHLNIILTILVFLALLVLVVSALGMASATSINIMERTREIGVMRAIGATPKMIYELFVTEGMIISVMSILLGVLFAWPLSVIASRFFGYLILGANTPLDFAFSGVGFLITLLITLAFGWLASRMPARKAITVSTREALVYE